MSLNPVRVHLIRTTGKPDEELWVPVAGFEAFYEVSNLGRIRSLPRWCWNGSGKFLRPAKVLKPYRTNGYLSVRAAREARPMG